VAEYVCFAFALPDGISTFIPNSHQIWTDEAAKEFARDMLRQVEAGAILVCAGCERVARTKLPAALMVMMPTDPSGRAIGGWLCRKCLRSEDPLRTLAAAFDRVAPGITVEPIQ